MMSLEAISETSGNLAQYRGTLCPKIIKEYNETMNLTNDNQAIRALSQLPNVSTTMPNKIV